MQNYYTLKLKRLDDLKKEADSHFERVEKIANITKSPLLPNQIGDNLVAIVGESLIFLESIPVEFIWSELEESMRESHQAVSSYRLKKPWNDSLLKYAKETVQKRIEFERAMITAEYLRNELSKN